MEESTRDIEIKIQDLRFDDDISFVLQMEDLSDRKAYELANENSEFKTRLL